MPFVDGKRPAGGSAVHSTSSARTRGSRRIAVALALILPLLAMGFAAGAQSREAHAAGQPEITSITPNSGPNTGGNTVTITGLNLSGVYQVTFGAKLATFDVISDTTIHATVPSGVGSVSVYATSSFGTSNLSQGSIYTYIGSFLPTVTDVVPSGGPLAGGNLVTIYGTGFTNASVVLFGAVSVSFTVESDMEIRTIAPPSQTPKTVDIRVTNPAGMSPATPNDDYVYSDAPIITYIEPDTGPITGGTQVFVHGTGFTGVVNITIGGTPVIFFEVLSDSLIVLTTPSRPAGSANIIVYKLGSNSATHVNTVFTYAGGKAVITGVSPSTGPATGGTVVALTGVNFTNATSVTFGGIAGTNLNVLNDGELRVTSPAHAGGTVDILIYNPSGSSLPSATAKFTYGTQTVTYTLQFRWNLIVWQGQDNVSVATALAGTGGGSVVGRVTAIYLWDAVAQAWRGNFPGAGNIPGANDFTTLRKGTAYWVALNSPPPATWTVAQ